MRCFSWTNEKKMLFVIFLHFYVSPNMFGKADEGVVSGAPLTTPSSAFRNTRKGNLRTI